MLELDIILKRTYYTSSTKNTFIKPVNRNSPEFIKNYSFTYFDGIYLLFQCLLTVGLHDSFPLVYSSRFVIVLFSFTICYLVVNQGLKIIKAYSHMLGFQDKYKKSGHYVILGDIEEIALVKILDHLRDPHIFEHNFKEIVIVRTKKPSINLIHLLETVYYDQGVYLIYKKDLDKYYFKAGLPSAKTIFLFTDRTSPSEKSDANSMLLSKVLNEYQKN